MLEFIGIGGPSFNFFNQVQGHYCCTGIKETWNEVREAVLEGLKGKEVILAGNANKYVINIHVFLTDFVLCAQVNTHEASLECKQYLLFILVGIIR